MLKEITKRLKQAKMLIFLMVAMIFIASCSRDVYQPQENIIVFVDNNGQAHLLLTAIEKFAKGNQYNYKTQASNADHLSKKDKFQTIFKNTDDNSFVSINNILKKQCVSISVYSGNNAKEAKVVMELIQQSIAPTIAMNRQEGC